jgi:hypothetical protein
MEQHYAFIKDGRVANIAVFLEQNEELADKVAIENGYDDAVWLGLDLPAIHSLYDGTTFTAPTIDYLYEIGVSNENQAMIDERAARQAAEDANKDSVV